MAKIEDDDAEEYRLQLVRGIFRDLDEQAKKNAPILARPDGAYQRYLKSNAGWKKGEVTWDEYRYAFFHCYDDLAPGNSERADQLLAQDRAIWADIAEHAWD
jgi:hypothetical protein